MAGHYRDYHLRCPMAQIIRDAPPARFDLPGLDHVPGLDYHHHHLAGYGLILHKTLPYPRRERRQVGARADDHPIRLLFYWNRLLWGARF